MQSRFRPIVAGTVLGLAILAPRLEAQNPQVLRASDEFPEPFSNISGIRVLSNGDMLVSDRIEKSVYRINFATGQYEPIGRNGQGPGDYEVPTNLIPLEDDLSLLVDMSNMRVARIDPTGDIDETWPVMDDGSFRMPTHGDGRGNVYWGNSSFSFGAGAPSTPPTEIPVLRWNLDADQIEEVTSLTIPPRERSRGIRIGSGGSVSGMPAPRPFRPRDQFAVGPDGRIAVARFDPYRVDWVESDGTVRTGPTIAYEPVEIRGADKEAWAEARAEQTMTMSFSSTGGGGSRTMTLPTPDLDEIEFPEFYPPFSEIFVDQEGRAWVQRYTSARDEGVLFDIVGPDGSKQRQVMLQEGRTLLGFGPGVAYAYYRDADDLQWIERYDTR